MKRDVFEFGRLEDSAGDLAGYGLVIAAVVLIILWIYRKDTAELSPAVRSVLILLRLSLLALLVIAFLEPQFRTETSIERPGRVLVAVDTSVSMTLDARAGSASEKSPSRIEEAVRVLRDTPLLEDLKQTHEILLYRFGRSLTPLGFISRVGEEPATDSEDKTQQPPEPDCLEKLAAIDDETRIGDAISGMLQENRIHPLAGVVLLTDGQSNAGATIDLPIEHAKELQAPIYPVPLGSDQPAVNVRLADLQIPSRAFKGDQIAGRFLVQQSGTDDRSLSVDILLQPREGEAEPVLLEQKTVELRDDGSPTSVEFQYLPELVGEWRVIARTKESPGETRSDDNRVIANLDVVDTKTKVLLLAGGPTREYRFLRNLLFRDKSIDVHIHLQSAEGSQAQEGDKVLAEFPKTRDELFELDVLVAVDPDWSALPSEAGPLIDEWVSTQSAGVVLIAGPVNTPRIARASASPVITALYPVVLKEVFTSDFDAGRFSQSWPIEFTREGELASFLRIDENAEVSDRKWKEFSGVYWCFPASSVKAGAVVLAHYTDPRAASSGVKPPLLASQFFGSGRVLYVGTGEIWRIRQLGEKYYDRLWVRLVREMGQSRLLRGSTRGAILVDADRVPLGSTLSVRAQLRGVDYQPLAEPIVPLSVVEPTGKPINIDMLPIPGQIGFYQALLPMRLPGEYRLQVLIPGLQDVIEKRLLVDVPERELAEPLLNRAGLTRLAEQTGGELIDVDKTERLKSLLKDKTETSILSGSPRPLWDNAWFMIAAIAIAGLEWLIRKLAYLA